MPRAALSAALLRATLLGGALLAAAATPASAAKLAGEVRAPADRDPPLAVHAWSAATGKRYSTTTAPGAHAYAIDVPPGRYIVFAVPAEPGAPPLYAGHTRFTLCARDAARLQAGACDDHALVEVEVGRKNVEGVDVTDWFLDGPTVADLARALDRPGDSWTESELAAPKFTEYPAARLVATAPGAVASPGSGPAPAGAVVPAAGAAPVLTLATPDATDTRLDRDRAALLAAFAAPPNYAGRFALVRVPCADAGAGEGANACEAAAVIDLATARVAYPPALNPLPLRDPCLERGRLQFRSDSRLLTLTARDADSLVTRYFVLNPDTLTLRTVASLASEPPARCAKQP
jgi:hypothetical protein